MSAAKLRRKESGAYEITVSGQKVGSVKCSKPGRCRGFTRQNTAVGTDRYRTPCEAANAVLARARADVKRADKAGYSDWVNPLDRLAASAKGVEE